MRSVTGLPRRAALALVTPAVWVGFLVLIAGLRAALVCQAAHEDGILRWRNLVTAVLIAAALICSSELVRFGASGEDLMAVFNMRHTIDARN